MSLKSLCKTHNHTKQTEIDGKLVSNPSSNPLKAFIIDLLGNTIFECWSERVLSFGFDFYLQIFLLSNSLYPHIPGRENFRFYRPSPSPNIYYTY